jgi:hypothetical protein
MSERIYGAQQRKPKYTDAVATFTDESFLHDE